MVKVYIFAGILAAIAIILKSPWFKGWIGELQINVMREKLGTFPIIKGGERCEQMTEGTLLKINTYLFQVANP